MPTVIIPDKICPHCNGTKWRTIVVKKATKDNPNSQYIRYRCVLKENERIVQWKLDNPVKLKIQRKRYNEGAKSRGYWSTPEIKQRFRIRDQQRRNKLSDSYLKKLWGKNPNNVQKLTEQDLHIYRTQLLTQRQLKQLEHGN